MAETGLKDHLHRYLNAARDALLWKSPSPVRGSAALTSMDLVAAESRAGRLLPIAA